jgi:hypothetical protein
MGWEYELETDIRYLQGIDKGIEKEKLASKITFVKSLLNEKDFSTKRIASIVGVSIEFVEKIKKDIS